jgi:hypothetical protein
MIKIFSSMYHFLKDICLSEAVKLYECVLLWNRLWWWKLNFYVSFLYLWDTRFRIVLREGKKHGPYSLNNYTPGETSLITIMKIFQNTRSGDALPFIDLGAGRGYAMFGASLLFKCPTVGVEILPGYVSKCRIMKEKLAVKDMEIVSGDILSFPLTMKGIYFCAATAFDGTLVEALEKKLAQVPPGSWVVIAHHPFKSPCFQGAYRGTEVLPFTWGWDNVFFYRVE